MNGTTGRVFNTTKAFDLARMLHATVRPLGESQPHLLRIEQFDMQLSRREDDLWYVTSPAFTGPLVVSFDGKVAKIV